MHDDERSGPLPTGNSQIDDIIQGLIAVYEAVFPERIRGYYLTGSYVAGGLNPLSDLDLLILFKGAFADDEERDRARRLNGAFYHARLTAIRLDLPARSERDLSPLDRILLKLASRPIYGEDVRDEIALPSLPDYTRATMELAYGNLARVLRGPDWRTPAALTYLLSYPDPDDEFFGYAHRRFPMWYPPEITGGLKELVTTVGRLATAIIALRAGRYVPQRADSVTLYREAIGDEWSAYVAEIYAAGKGRWGYLVPSDPAERAHLRDLCRQTLAFENHFLTVYRDFLLAESHDPDPARRDVATQEFRDLGFIPAMSAPSGD